MPSRHLLPIASADADRDTVTEVGLRAWQASFAGALHDPDVGVPDFLTSHTSDRPTKRFDVYRNNVYASLTETLRGRFPIVARLVGPQGFSSLARAFIGSCSPQSPALFEYGADFADFIEDFEHESRPV